MTTQKCLLVFCCLMLSLASFAQKQPTIHEVGLAINSGLDLGLVYKVGKPNRLFRLETLFLNGTHQVLSNGVNSNTYGVGFRLGAEFRKNIVDNLFLSYGFGAGFLYGGQNTGNDTLNQFNNVYSVNVNLLIGINYILKDRWVFSVEALPFIQYDITMNQGNSISNKIFYELNMESVRLVIAYRFGKKL